MYHTGLLLGTENAVESCEKKMESRAEIPKASMLGCPGKGSRNSLGECIES